jgi:imidazolonepropionase-like amidohydrolase
MSGRTLFKGATLIDGTGRVPLENAFLLVEDEQIAAVGVSAENLDGQFDEVVDISGKYLMPGMMNCHTHVAMDPVADMQAFFRGQTPVTLAARGMANLQKLLRSGTTFVRDMGAPYGVDLGLKRCMKEGVFRGPDLFCSGKVITMTGGHGWILGREADGPDDVRKAAREQLKAGADVIKIMATGGVLTPGVEPGSPQLTEEEIRAAVEEAHKAGKKTATHAQGTEGIKNAVRAGIDSVEHGCILDDEAVDMMLEKGTYMVPTLNAVFQIIENGVEAGIPEYAVEKCKGIYDLHMESFRKARDAGVKIACGTDASTPFNTFDMTAMELVLMNKAGMSEMEAIVSATKTSSELIGCNDQYGTLEKGKFADLLILDADPLADLNVLFKVVSVYKKGEPVVC